MDLPCRAWGNSCPPQAELARDPGPVVLAAETSGGKDDPLELHGPLGPGQLAAPVRRQWTRSPLLQGPRSGPPIRPRWPLHSGSPALVFILASPQTQALSLQAITAITSHLPPLCSLLFPLLATSSSSSVPPLCTLDRHLGRVSWLEGGAEISRPEKILPTPSPSHRPVHPS